MAASGGPLGAPLPGTQHGLSSTPLRHIAQLAWCMRCASLAAPIGAPPRAAGRLLKDPALRDPPPERFAAGMRGAAVQTRSNETLSCPPGAPNSCCGAAPTLPPPPAELPSCELERARLAGGMAPVYDSRRDEHHAERAAPLCICALSWHSLNTACDGHACCRAVRVTGLVMHWCLWCAKQPSYRSENPVRPPLAWLLVSSRAGFTLLAPCCSSAPACLAACNCA